MPKKDLDRRRHDVAVATKRFVSVSAQKGIRPHAASGLDEDVPPSPPAHAAREDSKDGRQENGALSP